MGRRWLLRAAVLAAAAAAAAYFFDPQNGRSRRIRAVERAGHIARMAERRARRQARYLEHTAQGKLSHLISDAVPSYAEDRTLLDRVESELFANRSIPHGRITFEVEGTNVILRGELDSAQEMERVEHAVGQIPGVTAVTSLFHLPGTPAPNKAEALAASAKAENNGGRRK